MFSDRAMKIIVSFLIVIMLGTTIAGAVMM